MDLREILKEAETVVVIGCSSRRTRPSYSVSRYLIQSGYTMIPVNPKYATIHEQPCYPDLKSVPGDVQIDVVNVFRNPRFVVEVIESVIRCTKGARVKPVVWTQLGVSSPAAERLARDAGLEYVANRCIMMEHLRLL